MPYPLITTGLKSPLRTPMKSPMQWPAFPDIPIYLEAADERATAKTYGTTPTTPTTPEVAPEILTHGRQVHASPSHLQIPEARPFPSTVPQPSPVDPSPTTTIQTSSDNSVIWPIQEPPPEIVQDPPRSRPALRFFPTQRPRVRLDTGPAVQMPQLNEKIQINEKTPINNTHHPGLGIVNGLPKPPSIEISPPEKEQAEPGNNIAQRIEETLWRYSASGNILKRWLLELLSWIFSAMCMAAVIGVLIWLKDKPLTTWSLYEKTGLTLNAYISILSKMAGAALILPVSEALGQLKWSWFLEHSKQMWDFEIFDNASRGPWGSLLLLIRTKGRALAALGAMIMLCSLALDPFFQQVVDFPDRWIVDETSSLIPRVQTYIPLQPPEYSNGFEVQQTDYGFEPVVRDFFYGNGTQPVPFGNGTRPEIPLACPTSNCTWPTYESLGVCSRCSEVSSWLNLTYACLNTTINWSSQWNGLIGQDPYPNGTACGYFLNATEEKPVLMSGYLLQNNSDQPGEALIVNSLPLTDAISKQPLYGVGSVGYRHVRNTIFDVLIASSRNGAKGVYAKEAPLVQECILSWCVQTIESAYSWGAYSENVTSSYLPEAPDNATWPWETVSVSLAGVEALMIIYGQNTTIEPPPAALGRLNTTISNNTYLIGNTTAANAIQNFVDIFPSSYTAQDVDDTPVLVYKNTIYGYSPMIRTLEYNPWQAPNNLSLHMERMATALSNVMRASNAKVMISGSAYNKENYVDVRWEWLTLPLGLLCISFIFLAATVTKSAVECDRVGVWKTSAYATLLYGLPDAMQHKLTRSASTGTPRSKAKELKVKIGPNRDWRVSGNLFSPFTPRPKPVPPPGWI